MTDEFVGEIAIDTSAGLATVSVVAPEIAPEVAVMVVVPWLALVARPLVPGLLLITATDAEDELQVTAAVIFFVLWSV
jgi:hypothetical protein